MIIICIQQSYLKRYKFCQIGQEKDKKKIKGGGLVLDEGGGKVKGGFANVPFKIYMAQVQG